MHVQTHTGGKKDLTPKNGAPPPLLQPPPPHTHTSSDTQSVYMCAHKSGGGDVGGAGLVVWRKVATCQYGAY